MALLQPTDTFSCCHCFNPGKNTCVRCATLVSGMTVLLLQDRELEELEILNLFHQIVAAICYLHEHSVLHRDLKTANLFLTKEGDVKLGDFGVAKVMMTGSEAHTILGEFYLKHFGKNKEKDNDILE